MTTPSIADGLVYAADFDGKAVLVVNVASKCGLTPQYDDLETIVRTSLEWERKIADRDPSAYWPD